MVLHSHIFSGEAQVGFGNTRLDDHFFQKLGVHLSVRDTDRIEYTFFFGIYWIQNHSSATFTVVVLRQLVDLLVQRKLKHFDNPVIA